MVPRVLASSNPGLKLANAFGVNQGLNERRPSALLCGYLGPGGKRATVLFVALDHPIECAAIDAEDLGGACAIAAGDFEDV